MNKNEMLLEESLHFIGDNLNIWTDEIPGHLRQFWKVEEGKVITDETDQYKVFMAALALHKFSKTGLEVFRVGIERLDKKLWKYLLYLEIGLDNITKRFGQWQALLTEEEEHFSPMKLFDFDNYDKMFKED